MNQYRFVVFLLAGIFHRADDYFKAFTEYAEKAGGVCVAIDIGSRSAKFNEEPNRDITKLHLDFEINFAEMVIEKVLHEWKEHEIIGEDTIIAVAGHSKGALEAAKLCTRIKDVDKALLWAPAMPYDINILSLSSILSFTSVLFSRDFWHNLPVKRSFENTVRGIFNSRMPDSEMHHRYDNGLFFESPLIIKQLAGSPINLSLGSRKLMDATRVDYEKMNMTAIEGYVVVAEEDKIVPQSGAIKFADQLGFDHEVFPQTSHDVFWGQPGQEVIKKSVDFLLN